MLRGQVETKAGFRRPAQFGLLGGVLRIVPAPVRAVCGSCSFGSVRFGSKAIMLVLCQGVSKQDAMEASKWGAESPCRLFSSCQDWREPKTDSPKDIAAALYQVEGQLGW